ncbi:hypothetical protein SAICODRAFT_37568 [Saitoella complicata NRRL Y-17804]|uniref:Uncharacterized protein n=1 Tax=Saitoella complicata (strain BCRC 22490 / CBS 7301 / JCM 7358 / NBRC 10748 / NRRL Y-17804) TaxID=698492 RepID=A0A0E9NCZ0_SAICN|nr:uncharacterized protein SAICODRAFT_37568 [Saitoella complicata NRRL Y-17804]ODQ49873.1 hypothetical protein SAICODRAFT_37568 [Saitoella complicata NRRL Y-17804]GAO47704.1 hypothetical protein G7K_1903-t1 [Saitoella complicata NRRL Y-17804]
MSFGGQRTTRAELFASDDADHTDHAQENDAETRAAILAALSASLTLPPVASDSVPITTPPANEEEGGEEVFEFNLFGGGGGMKIKVADDAPVEEKWVRRERPMSYYVVDPSDEVRRAQIEAAAISGTQILQLSTHSLEPLLTKPRKLLRISAHTRRPIPAHLPPTITAAEYEAANPRRRWRPSKKRREFEKRKKAEAEEKARRKTAKAGRGGVRGGQVGSAAGGRKWATE